jgi:hypothetical protein
VRDLYDAAAQLVDLLRADAAHTWADAIEDAIESGSTGTEILMALRSRLAGIKAAGELREETRAFAATLADDIDAALDAIDR